MVKESSFLGTWGNGTYFAGFIHLFIHKTFTEFLQKQSKLAGAGMIALQDSVL